MKKLISSLALLCTSFSLLADEGYRYTVNLNKVENDRVTVTLYPPTFTVSEVDFMFPAMVPGTYEVYDFGRFVSNLSVKGKNGTDVKVTKVDVNTYRLSPATAIDRITYQVDDTFDKSDLPGTNEKVVFEPGGTNFEEGKNFSLNTHSMFGYFKGLTSYPIQLEFEKPEGFYPSTGLSDLKLGQKSDTLKASSYHELIDSPIMYSRPDTASIQVSGAKVLVSCYSPRKQITAHFIAGTLVELLLAQADYLGGQLPVSKYAFLFYFTDKPTLSGANGALEHSYSSFYVMPEFDSLLLQQQLRDVAAHEFFHIVTPLNIHSHEIGEFDFNNPRMSEHLWLYEGMTEYAAHHAQAKAGIIDVNQLLNVMMQKYETSLEEYNDTMSFTFMSRNVLDEKVHKQYGNVYEKGAVIGMCLDILLRDLSNGQYGTQDLMSDLATKYGKNKSFDDKDLFNDIEQFTYPEVGAFLRKHVGGKEPLPMADILGRIGIDFIREEKIREFSLGNADLNYNQDTKRLFVEGTSNLDEFGMALGYKPGDEFWKINGNELRIDNVKDVISSYYANIKEGDKVSVEVYRPKGKKGNYKKKTLSAKARKVDITRKNIIAMKPEVTEKQKRTLKTWAGL